MLLPSCDTSAWTYAAYADKLSPHFCLYAPPLETMDRILDKGRLETACADAGVPVLKSWMVRDEAGVCADCGHFAVPAHNQAAPPMSGAGEMRRARSWRTMINWSGHFAASGDRRGFLTQTATTPTTRSFFCSNLWTSIPRGSSPSPGSWIEAARTSWRRRCKRLLRSEPAGVGVCFESTPLDPALAEQTARLCRRLGYFGVFEVEFIWDGPAGQRSTSTRASSTRWRWTSRGLPLARLCYYDAIGDSHRLASLVKKAQAASPEDQLCVRDGFTMALILTFRRLTGRISRRDRLRWRQWNKSNRAVMKDLMRAWDDPWVWPVHIVSEVKLGLRQLFNLAKIRWAEAGQAECIRISYRSP